MSNETNLKRKLAAALESARAAKSLLKLYKADRKAMQTMRMLNICVTAWAGEKRRYQARVSTVHSSTERRRGSWSDDPARAIAAAARRRRPVKETT